MFILTTNVIATWFILQGNVIARLKKGKRSWGFFREQSARTSAHMANCPSRDTGHKPVRTYLPTHFCFKSKFDLVSFSAAVCALSTEDFSTRAWAMEECCDSSLKVQAPLWGAGFSTALSFYVSAVVCRLQLSAKNVRPPLLSLPLSYSSQT